MSDITPIRPEGEFNEDPLESMLDEESDEDFGYVVTRDRAAGPDGHPVKLAEWSAQDFASIYTRFRPHLERHARRFLHNPSQVDEVVQDAFLYLMVSLPELDSEIGVLRFLKWKVRLLCLDVIRASGKAYLSSIDDVAEPVSSDPEVSSYLEQQDDAAVLRLALSKLNPRHREVLLASIYEEKSTEQIAAQVGLSENATRQLIFRARAAFKKALLGDDVNTNGMSAAAILSVAARKAAMEAKKVGAQAMVFVLFLMLAIGAFVNFTGRGTQTQQVAQGGTETQAPSPSTQSPTPVASESASTGKVVQVPATPAPTPSKTAKPALPVANAAGPAPSASPNPSAAMTIVAAEQAPVFHRASIEATDTNAFYSIDTGKGLLAEIQFKNSHFGAIGKLDFKFEIGNQIFFLSPDLSKLEVLRSVENDGYTRIVTYVPMKYVFDEAGKVLNSPSLTESQIRLELLVNEKNHRLVWSNVSVLT